MKRLFKKRLFINYKQHLKCYVNCLNLQVEKFLGLPLGTLRGTRVGRAEVTFKVVPNDKNYNATDVANSIGIIIYTPYLYEYEF